MVHAETDWQAANPDLPQVIDAEWDAAPTDEVETSEPPAELPAEEATAAEALCPTCGELLAWHDEFASCAAPAAGALGLPVAAEAAAEFSQEPVAEATERPRLFGRATPNVAFAYELGRLVQPAPAGAAQIIWRGQLKERHPDTGLIHRVNVYRLNDGYWDCYREEELQAA